MTKSIFYASDMDIFDALYSSKQKMTIGVLLEMLRNRGILVSEEINRDEITEYISSLIHDYYLYDYLMECVSPSSRTEKISSKSIDTEISDDEIQNAFSQVKDDRQERDESFSISKRGNKHVIEVKYTEIDHSKTRLRQRTHKEATIEIEEINGSFIVRHPSNDRLEEVVDNIIDNIKSQRTEDEIETNEISFAGIESPDLRTRFFTELINSLPEFVIRDVRKIQVNHIQDTPTPTPDDTDIDTENGTQRNHEDVERELIGMVEKAILNGESLLSSREFQHFARQGFYISSIRWVSEKTTTPRLKVEFDAHFSDANQCSKFSYNISGAYRPTDDGFTKTKRPLEEHEKSPLITLLERTAQDAFNTIIESIEDE